MSTIWKTLTRKFGDLMHYVRSRCNDITIRLLNERLKDKQHEIALIAMNLVEMKSRKENIERQIINTSNRQKQKIEQLRQLKVEADKRFQMAEDRYYEFIDETSDIRKQQEVLSKIPCT